MAAATGLDRPFPPLAGEAPAPERAALGRLLFFDPVLSEDGDLSCAHCHQPARAFADGLTTARGRGGRPLARNTPTLWNVAFKERLMWDRRAGSLEEQARIPLLAADEMAADPLLLVARLAAIPEYRARFERAFPGQGGAITFDDVTRALAAFERTLVSRGSRYDRYARGERGALTPAERRGLTLFRSLNTRCFECHRLPTFDAPLALGVGVPSPDPGRRRRHRRARRARTVRRADAAQRGANGPIHARRLAADARGRGGFLPARRRAGARRRGRSHRQPGARLLDPRRRGRRSRRVPRRLERRIREPARARAGTVRASDSPHGDEAMRWILLCLLLVACATPASAPAQNLRVRSGESIAAALELAKPGTVIEVEPGVYHEALVVDTPNVTLRGIVSGSERPVLDGRGVLNDGVIASGSPFTMTGFAVRHYKGNGVSTQGVDGVFLNDLVVDDTGLYGVYPVQSKNISVTHCTVTRIRDAGIYVGESQGALVAMNYVHHNVAGIEIENTNDAEVRDNLAHDNTAGILVFVLPGKVLKEGKRSRVHRNWVVTNNTPNFGDPESIVGSLPFGIGILLMGADDTVVENNQVRENASLGIAITRLAAEHAKKDPPLEPMTDRARIVSNHLDANGTAPHPSIVQGYGGGGDFGWDGTGVDNCADLADGARTVGAPIGACLDAARDALGRWDARGAR